MSSRLSSEPMARSSLTPTAAPPATEATLAPLPRHHRYHHCHGQQHPSTAAFPTFQLPLPHSRHQRATSAYLLMARLRQKKSSSNSSQLSKAAASAALYLHLPMSRRPPTKSSSSRSSSKPTVSADLSIHTSHSNSDSSLSRTAV